MESTHTQPNIAVIFEDAHILVINKPHGVLSQEDHTGDPNVLSLCKKYLSQSAPKKKPPYLGLLHRLDRPVGGLMMLAKTPQAAQNISRQMRDRLVQKTYHAVVQGHPPTNGLMTHYLWKDKQANIVDTVTESPKKGKKAVLSFTTLNEADNLSLLAVHLQTGRPHQIRVQLAAEGYPIWGDYKYGFDQPDGRTMALQAVEIVLNHPATAEEMRFTLPHPDTVPWDVFE